MPGKRHHYQGPCSRKLISCKSSNALSYSLNAQGQQTDRIRIAALESLIKHLAPHVNIPLLTPEGELNIPEDPIATSGHSGDDSVVEVGEMRSDPELERAFDVLERQSREVAKVNFKL